jgi:pSer/pThr/pTyr-binding forkhead associated (FHA) protein
MATLYLLDEDGAMAGEYEIGARPVTIGRDQSATVIINDDTLSRRHFIISREGQGYVLQDLGSQNGTWVSGHQALKERTRLRHNVCILAGRTLFLFSEHRLPTATLSEPQGASRSANFLPAGLAVTRGTSAPNPHPGLA